MVWMTPFGGEGVLVSWLDGGGGGGRYVCTFDDVFDG